MKKYILLLFFAFSVFSTEIDYSTLIITRDKPTRHHEKVKKISHLNHLPRIEIIEFKKEDFAEIYDFYKTSKNVIFVDLNQRAEIRDSDPYLLYDINRRVNYYNQPGSFYRDEYEYWINNTGEPSKLYGSDLNYQSQEFGGTTNDNIHLDNSWDLTKGTNVIICIIDSGLDVNHPDLVGLNVIGGISFYRGITNNDWSDVSGHGTAITGIIAAQHNEIGIRGISPESRILVVKTSFLLSEVLAGIDYAISNGANIINGSWGFTGSPPYSLGDAIVEAGNNGIIFSFAALNQNVYEDTSADYPLDFNLDNVIGVTSLDRSLENQYNPSGFSSNVCHIFAPGRAIVSTGLNNDYYYHSGTSFATAFVTANLALIKSYYPGESFYLTKYRLVNSAEVLPSLIGRVQSNGRLSIINSLTNNVPLPVLSLTQGSNSMNLTVSGPTNLIYSVEWSPDLNIWMYLNRYLSTNTDTIINDGDIVFLPNKFYRVKYE